MQFEHWMEDDRPLQRREVFTWTWLKYSSVPHIKLCTASEHLKYCAENFMLFYVFVAFVGLNNNTILAMQNIEFGSSRQTDTPIQQKMAVSKRYRSWISYRRTPSNNLE